MDDAPTPGQAQASGPPSSAQAMAAATPPQPPHDATATPGRPMPVTVSPPQLDNLIAGWDRLHGADTPMTARHVILLLFDLGVIGGVHDGQLRREVGQAPPLPS